jgi:fructose-1,6-bisphosphatase/inositol monophosphatase family enzyme
VAIVVARQINRRRSRGAAALSLAAVSLAVLDLVVNVGPGAWLILALLFLLWSFNGLRATLVHEVMG